MNRGTKPTNVNWTAHDGGGIFIDDFGGCESWMAEPTHWWIERWLEYVGVPGYLSAYMGASQNARYGSRARAHTRSIPHDPYPDPYPIVQSDPYPTIHTPNHPWYSMIHYYSDPWICSHLGWGAKNIESQSTSGDNPGRSRFSYNHRGVGLVEQHVMHLKFSFRLWWSVSRPKLYAHLYNP